MAPIARGCASALSGSRPFWRIDEYEHPHLQDTVDQLEIGYWLGLQMIWSYFGGITDGEPLGEPDASVIDQWPYGQTPEQWISNYREALEARK